MKLYHTKSGLLMEHEDKFYLTQGDWDTFINNDDLYNKMKEITSSSQPVRNATEILESQILAPLKNQELWACGVTYIRSKVGRQEESKASGGADFYGKVYEAERPEIFFKSTPHRVVGHGGKVAIRRDSTWDVPEPELTLVVTSSGKIVGYTIGNDMSSRSIEGENPLYLPQAKTYDGCASVGPCVFVTEESLPADVVIEMQIMRNGLKVYDGNVSLDQMKRTPKELASFVYRACSFPYGSLIMTGTGIVPSSDFTLKDDDEIRITIQPIGTLVNTVVTR